ncbi:hypothetical protein L0F63_007054 [Massospora cicadina]|nr:hypothetical protein L0F63_007054 [Massospora cicadina]
MQSERFLSLAQLRLKATTSWAKKIQHLRNSLADILAIQERGRFLAIMITWQGNQYTLVNTYAPNIPSDRANFFGT